MRLVASSRACIALGSMFCKVLREAASTFSIQSSPSGSSRGASKVSVSVHCRSTSPVILFPSSARLEQLTNSFPTRCYTLMRSFPAATSSARSLSESSWVRGCVIINYTVGTGRLYWLHDYFWCFLMVWILKGRKKLWVKYIENETHFFKRKLNISFYLIHSI